MREGHFGHRNKSKCRVCLGKGRWLGAPGMQEHMDREVVREEAEI